jgi:ABC-type antimicrobial peptide transport system permease subunit
MQFDSGGTESVFINLIALLIGLGIGLVVSAVIAYLLSSCYAVIPAEHRAMEPGMCWLLLIPIFSLYWNFRVYLGLSDSFASAFRARGENLEPAQTGRTTGKAFCILAVVSLVPCLGTITALVALVCMIIYLIKAFELKRRLVGLGADGGGWASED